MNIIDEMEQKRLHEAWQHAVDKGLPLGVSEAIRRLKDELSDEVKDYLRDLPREELIGEHFGVCLWIRNNLFSAWLMEQCRDQGCKDLDWDGASGWLLERYWRELQGER